MTITFVPTVFGPVTKDAINVLADGSQVILKETLTETDITFLKIADAATGVDLNAKLLATTLPNGRNARKFFLKRIVSKAVLTARYTKMNAAKDVGATLVSQQETIAELLAGGGSGSSSGASVFNLPFVGVVGDSRSSQNWSTTTEIPSPISRSYLWFAQVLTKGRFQFSHMDNFGVSGDDIAQIKTRIMNDVANPYGRKFSESTTKIWVLLAGTNSLSGGGGFATMTADYMILLNKMLENDRKVIVVAEWPRDGLSSASSRLMYRFAEWLRRLKTINNVYVVDVWPETADPASSIGGARAGTLSDGTHGSAAMALSHARPLAKIIDSLTTPVSWTTSSNGDVYHATDIPNGNLVVNPMLVQGTGGTVGTGGAGVAPQSWALTASSGLTATGSFVTSDGRPAFRVVVTGTTTASLGYFDLRQAGVQSNSAISSGDVLVGGFEIKIAAGHTNLSSPGVMIDPGSSVVRLYGGLALSGDVAIPAALSSVIEGVAMTPPYTVPNPVPASVAFDARIQFAPSAASSLTIDFFGAFLRKQ